MFYVTCMLLAGAIQGGGDQGTRTDDPGSVIQHLKRFHIVYAHSSGDPQPARTLASSLLAALEGRPRMERDRYLSYYEGHCKYVLDQLADARRLAERIALDGTAINQPEAIRLLTLIEVRTAQNDPLGIQRSIREARLLTNCFPAGISADRLMWMDHGRRRKESRVGNTTISTPYGGDLPFMGKDDDLGMIGVGDLYCGMSMYRDALRAYRLAAGLMNSGAWISERSVALWRGSGDAHAKLGEWDRAIACYYKAIASGGPLRDLTPRLIGAQKAQASGRKSETPAAKPDRAQLWSIAKLCAETDLYDEAIRAATSATRAGLEDKARVELFTEVLEAKLRTLQRCLHEYGPGVNFRGTVVTEAVIKATRAELAKVRD